MRARLTIWLLYSLLFALIIGIASGYQTLGLSRDYLNYLEFFDFVRYSHNISEIDYRFEPAFTIIVYWLTRMNLSNSLIYSFIAGAAVFVKYSSIRYSRNYWIAISVFTFYFISRYLILFEMTVLRAACAFALVFFVFFNKTEEKYKLKDVVVLVVAILFHYSSLVFIPIYFTKKLTRRKIVYISLFLFIFIYFLKSPILAYLPNYIGVFSTYEVFRKATFLPIPFAIDIGFLFVIFYFWKGNDLAMKYCAFGIALSIAIHFSLIEYSLLASRFRELLSVFILIYVTRASIGNHKKIKYASLLYVFVTGLMHLYVTIVHDPLLS